MKTTYEQRKATAELVGRRVTGTVSGELRVDGAPASPACARCGGERTITIPCPNCTPGDDGDGDEGDGRAASLSPARTPVVDYVLAARRDLARLKAGGH